MFMRPTQFAPQFNYNESEQLGAAGRYNVNVRRVAAATKRAKLNKQEARVQFSQWLQTRFPRIADRARIGSPLQGMGDVTPADPNQPWYQNLLNYAPQAVAAAAQYKLIRTNMKRAEKGLAPIDTAIAAPTVRVQTELDPATRQTVNYVGYGAAALGALVGLKLLKII